MADETSILYSTKKALGLADDYPAFDSEIIMHINSVFSTLNQLGVGPVDGFVITDDSELWEDFLAADVLQNHVKSYMYLRVRMLFDPPTLSYLLTAFKEQIQELEWRINIQRESTVIDPNAPDDETVLSGGSV